MSPAGANRGHFADRLLEALDAARSPACVGLDPVVERLPGALRSERAGAPDGGAAMIEEFCIGVLDAIADVVRVVKPQSACFERFGAPGVAALRAVIGAAQERGMIVILDAKRGDIGVTAEHYAHAAFDTGADALTVNPSLGVDTLEPYLSDRWRGRGVFALVRTSNPGSDALQTARLADGRTVAEMTADEVARVGEAHVGRRGYSALGAVVGATKPDDAAALRERMPRQILLVPGFGAQGGTVETVRPLFRRARSGGPEGALVTASRSVLYPVVGFGSDWRSAVHDAAARFADDLANALR